MIDWLFKWLPDWLFDSLSTFTWLIGANLRLSITWPISSLKYWIYAVLKHFILKEHKTIKRGSEFQNSWQGNFTVAWITGKYYQHISRWKGLQQSKLGEASGTLKSIVKPVLVYDRNMQMHFYANLPHCVTNLHSNLLFEINFSDPLLNFSFI